MDQQKTTRPDRSDGSRWRRVAAVAVSVLISILYVGSVLLFQVSASEDWINWLGALLSYAVWLFAFSLVGLLIAFHRPRHAIAWICLGFGLVWALWIFADSAIRYEGLHPGTLARPDLIAALAYPLWVPGVGLIAYLLLLFPDGHIPSPRWRPLLLVMNIVVTLLVVTSFFLPGLVQDTNYENPLGVDAFALFDTGVVGIGLVLMLIACLLASAVSVVVRYRRASGTERLQLKWLLAAGALSAIGYAFLFVREFEVQLVWAVIPIAIGLAILRHRLYDIDRLISRTIGYSLVIGLLAVVYVGVVFLMRELLPMEGRVPVAASTLAAAALFNPMRRRVQDRVDRRFNRTRHDAWQVADAYGRSLSNEVDPDRIVDGWIGVISRTIQPVTVGVWVRGSELNPPLRPANQHG